MIDTGENSELVRVTNIRETDQKFPITSTRISLGVRITDWE